MRWSSRPKGVKSAYLASPIVIPSAWEVFAYAFARTPSTSAQIRYRAVIASFGSLGALVKPHYYLVATGNMECSCASFIRTSEKNVGTDVHLRNNSTSDAWFSECAKPVSVIQFFKRGSELHKFEVEARNISSGGAYVRRVPKKFPEHISHFPYTLLLIL